jgi:hypothetical protein
MNCSFPWLGAAAVVVAAVLAVPSHGADKKDYIDRSPSDQIVWYKGQGVQYFILADGRIYPGTVRDDKFIIWHRAEPLLVSEYAYGGPSSRLVLIEANKIDYQTEPLPKELKRVTAPKEKK